MGETQSLKLLMNDKRFFFQAVLTAYTENAKAGDIIDAYNQRINKTGISPTVTTRPEGFKTAILVVVDEKN